LLREVSQDAGLPHSDEPDEWMKDELWVGVTPSGWSPVMWAPMRGAPRAVRPRAEGLINPQKPL